jgi:hypothetical protein
MPQPEKLQMTEADRKVAAYVQDFEKRLPEYEKMRKQYLREVGADAFSSFFVEHFAFGNVNVYEEQLHGMLSDDEAQRLRSDVELTKAWRIFVKMRWAHKQLVRTLIILGIAVGLPLLIWGSIAAFMESVRSGTSFGK